MRFFAALIATSLVLPITAHAGFEASSFRKESKRGENFWNAGSALDSRNETAWMVDPEKKNEGQWIQLDTPPGEVDKIALVPGWDVDDNSFFDYARIKKARVEAWSIDNDGKETQVLEEEITVEDKRGWQIIDVTDAKMGSELNGGRVRVTVLEVYPGKDYPNLAVSEMRVHLKEFEAGTMQIKDYPEDAADGRGPNYMEDLKDSTFWASAGSCEAKFSVMGNGYGLSSLGIKPGPAGYKKPKTVQIRANDLTVTHTMEDSTNLQWLLLPVVVGYTGSAWGTVDVIIEDCYEGDKGVAIAEVKLNAATIEDI